MGKLRHKYQPPDIDDVPRISPQRASRGALFLALVKQFGGILPAEILANAFKLGEHNPQKKLQTLRLEWAINQIPAIQEKLDKLLILLSEKGQHQELLQDLSNHVNSIYLSEISFEKCRRRQSILISILIDISRHFQYERNPLLNSYHQTHATRNCLKYCAGDRMKTPELPLYPSGKQWAPELLWAGEEDHETIRRLRNYRNQIQVSVHSMMVSTIASLTDLNSMRGIKISLSCPSSTSPRHISSLTDGKSPCDFLITADAGVSFASDWNNFRRVLTVWQEEHLMIANNDKTNICQVLVAPETTQQKHYEIASDEGALPKEKLEVKIENLFVRAKDLLPEQAILLTYPKAQPFLKQLDFHVLIRETRGITFGLYVRKDIEQDLEIAFVRALIFSYNRCKSKFENFSIPNREKYRRQLLQKMARVPGFVTHYGLGTFQDV